MDRKGLRVIHKHTGQRWYTHSSSCVQQMSELGTVASGKKSDFGHQRKQSVSLAVSVIIGGRRLEKDERREREKKGGRKERRRRKLGKGERKE